MSDGRVRFQPRPSEYETQAQRDSFALNSGDEDDEADSGNIECCNSDGHLRNAVRDDDGVWLRDANGIRMTDYMHSSESNLTSTAAQNQDQALRREQTLAQCTLAKTMGIEVYTIAFDIDPSDAFFDEATLLLKRCALDLSLSDMTDEELRVFTPTNYLNAQGGAELNASLNLISGQITRLQLFQ
jgi:hypothetical protein